jgi:hypothetical protein
VIPYSWEEEFLQLRLYGVAFKMTRYAESGAIETFLLSPEEVMIKELQDDARGSNEAAGAGAT